MGANTENPLENHWNIIRKPWGNHGKNIGKPFETPLDNHEKHIGYPLEKPREKHRTTIANH